MTYGRASIRVPAILTVSLLGSVAAAHAGENAASSRGAATFAQYCALCHGAEGKGDGRAARVQQVRPADLTRSARSAAYKSEIIRKGGAAMNRSSSMPSWGEVLSASDIDDIVAYLQTLSATDRASSTVRAAVVDKQPAGSTP
jgi:mono/diheme cytochrome c family protein